MSHFLRISVLALAAAISLASAAPQSAQPPVAAPMAPGNGACETACGHYLQCHGVNDAGAYQQCVGGCRQSQPDPQALAQFAATDCATLTSAEVSSQAPGSSGLGGPPAGQGQSANIYGSNPGAFVPPTPASPATPGMGAVAGGCQPYGGEGADPQLYQLLLQSSWCSFSYASDGNYNGSSSSSRVSFAQSGVASVSTGGESAYSGTASGWSGPAGAWGAAGQSSAGQSFCWRLQGTALLLSQDGRTWGQPLPLVVKPNSNGYPIITAGGTEYSMCN